MRKTVDAFGNPMITPEVSFVTYQSADEWVVETYKNGVAYKDIKTFLSVSLVADWIGRVLKEEEVLQ